MSPGWMTTTLARFPSSQKFQRSLVVSSAAVAQLGSVCWSGFWPPAAFLKPTQKRSISEWCSQKIGSKPASWVNCIQPVRETSPSPLPVSLWHPAPCGLPSSVSS